MSDSHEPQEDGSHILDEKPGMHGRQAYVWFFGLLIAAIIALFFIVIPILNFLSPGTGTSYQDFLFSRTLIADISLIFTLWGLGWLIGTIFNMVRLSRKLKKSSN